MNYALIETGVVINLIWLYEGNAQEFPNAVPTGGRPVGIGDSYADGVFTRGGEPVLTEGESILKKEDLGEVVVLADGEMHRSEDKTVEMV